MLENYIVDQKSNMSLWVCQCGFEQCERQHSYGPAVREHYLIHFITEGTGVYQCASGTYSLQKGQGFLILPNEITLYTASYDAPWSYYWIGFQGADALRLLQLCGLSPKEPVFDFPNTEEFTALFKNLFAVYHNPNLREYSMIGYLYLILSNMMAQSAKRKPVQQNVQIYLNAAISYMQNNYPYAMSIQLVAAHIGIERSYLYRIFKKELGMAPEQYLFQIRLHKAVELLQNTNYTVLQIALSVGFKDLSHFSNAFKKHFGRSPTKFRMEWMEQSI